MKVIVCDDCKKKDREAMAAFLPTKFFQPDPAGGAASREVNKVDLCLYCAVRRLEKVLEEQW